MRLASPTLAGAIMWIPSSLLSMAAVFCAAVEWFRKDEARQGRPEALEDAGRRWRGPGPDPALARRSGGRLTY